MKNADLHTHSHYSDGQVSPTELVKLAKKRKIKHLALTDHNTIKGIPEAIREAKKQNINLIPGIELQTNDSELLGLFVDYKNKQLINFAKKLAKDLEDSTKDFCKEANKLGFPVTFKEIKKKYPKSNLNVFHPLITLHHKGYGKTSEIYSKLEQAGLKRKKITFPTTIQVIKIIKKAGGKPILAHPWLSKGDVFKRIPNMVKAGLAGIELSNGDDLKFMRAKSKNKYIVKRMRYIAKKHNLILTKGTDFHGEKVAKLMPGNHFLGKNNCDESIVKKLEQI